MQFDKRLCDIQHGLTDNARRAVFRRQLSFLFCTKLCQRSDAIEVAQHEREQKLHLRYSSPPFWRKIENLGNPEVLRSPRSPHRWKQFLASFLLRDAVLAQYMLWPSVRPSVTCLCYITEITQHHRPGILVLCCRKYPQNSTGITPYEVVKCRWGGVKSMTFDK